MGTVAGSAVFLSPRRVHRLGAGVVTGALLLGCTMIAVSTAGEFAAAIVILGLGGIGYAMAEVGSVTIVQQRATARTRVQVLGIVESVRAVHYAIGAAVAGFLAARLGARQAFVWTGGAAVAVAAALGAALVVADRSTRDRVDSNHMLEYS